MSELNVTLNPKLILKRAEPAQSTFIAVRFNSRTGKTLLDRASAKDSLAACRTAAEADRANPHRIARIIELKTKVIRHLESVNGGLVEVNRPSDDEDEDTDY